MESGGVDGEHMGIHTDDPNLHEGRRVGHGEGTEGVGMLGRGIN